MLGVCCRGAERTGELVRDGLETSTCVSNCVHEALILGRRPISAESLDHTRWPAGANPAQGGSERVWNRFENEPGSLSLHTWRSQKPAFRFLVVAFHCFSWDPEAAAGRASTCRPPRHLLQALYRARIELQTLYPSASVSHLPHTYLQPPQVPSALRPIATR